MLENLFLPHPKTHKKAHLISPQALVVYILLFITLQFGIRGLSLAKPDILGISSNVEVSELITLTNQARQSYGLPALSENSALDQAAAAKAKNMFEENYWAHYSPSGKDPWGFITSAGYKFSYAGENLAKNFQTSSEVVNAWMASPKHRENILNNRYTDIGMAVARGTLNGQDTVLVVQEFGTPAEYVAKKTAPAEVAATSQTPPLPPGSASLNSPAPRASITPSPATLAGNSSNLSIGTSLVNNPKFDALGVTKIASLSLIFFVAALLMVDLVALQKRAVFRLSSKHLSHFALLAVAASVIASSRGGSIL